MKQALSAEIRSQLVRIAEGRLAHARNTKDWVEPVNYTVLGVELYRLACEVSGVESVSDPEILPTFFTEDAVAVLMTMPNQYWFWTIFQESVTSESDEVARVRVEMVRHVMVHRQRSASIQFGLHKKPEELTVPEACARVAEGILLVRPAGNGRYDQYVTVLNPVYCSPDAH